MQNKRLNQHLIYTLLDDVSESFAHGTPGPDMFAALQILLEVFGPAVHEVPADNSDKP